MDNRIEDNKLAVAASDGDADRIKVSRRNFFAMAGRIAAGAAVAAGAAWLIGRKRPGNAADIANGCVNNGACTGCGQIESCGLPQGQLARRWKKEADK